MFDNDFNKRFEKARRQIAIATIVNYAVLCGLIAFVIWVVVRVMMHFGIV